MAALSNSELNMVNLLQDTHNGHPIFMYMYIYNLPAAARFEISFVNSKSDLYSFPPCQCNVVCRRRQGEAFLFVDT